MINIEFRIANSELRALSVKISKAEKILEWIFLVLIRIHC